MVENYTQTQKKSGFKRFIGKLKEGYSYLAPGYRAKKLFQLIIMAPTMFLVYMLLYFIIYISLVSKPNQSSLIGGIIGLVMLVLIVVSTIASAYYWPFSYYWYVNESAIGKYLNSIVYIGTFTGVLGRIMATYIGGIIIAGTFAPIMGPWTLRKCKKHGFIIGVR